MKNFGKRLKSLREKNNLTIEQLVKEMAWGKFACVSIEFWENNHLTLSIYSLIQLSKYFNVSVDYLLGLED